jgi:NADPH:quinone reductase-like Zn-dependent oxidoreductase
MGRQCAEDAPFRFELQRPGTLDWFSARHLLRAPPQPNEIEIEVAAVGLNFKDLMLAMGMLPTDAIADDPFGGAIGQECAGRVVAVGERVSEFALGDEVVLLGPNNFASHVTVDARRAAHKPRNLSLDDAATVPIVFMTALYSLHTLAQLQPRERVLIHSAAGGVGLAAVQVALKAGAVVFATAGSQEKRELLSALGVPHVMDSRTLAFADEVMDLTQGEGIDVVLNSLAGDAIEKSLALLQPYGRFIEIGKVDIYANRRLGMRFLRRNISFATVELGDMWARRPKLGRSLLHEVLRLFERNELRPLPQHVFAVSQVAEAFQCMAQGRHVGKLAVSMHERAGLPVAPLQRRASIASDGSYLITGGLGGFGLAVADHLARRGARRVALIGRSPPSSSAQPALQSLRARGVEVMVCEADIADDRLARRVISDVQRAMGPLRGVIHAAMVLDDAPIEHLTEARMWSAMAPKMLGAWNLHSLTASCPLDFFILFSSAASIFGNPGQASYVAGNMFLDALAHYRRARGQPALAVNWGAVGGSGHLANNPEACERVARLGIKPVPVSEMLALLDKLMFSEAAQIAVAEVDWKAVMRSFGGRIPAKFAELAAGVTSAEDGLRSSSHVRTILEAKETAVPALLETYLREHLARAMGASPARIDVCQPLLGLGLDSLIAVDVRNRVSGDLGINVPLTIFMQGATIQSVAEYMAQRLKGRDRSRPYNLSDAGLAQTSDKLPSVLEDARGRAT